MLPELRRYALALTGDRYSGDWYVGVVLESLVERQPALSPECDVRTELYRLLGQAVKLDWPGVLDGTDEPDAEDGEPEAALRRRILCLPLFTRQVLLLVALGGFSTEQAGAICGLTAAQAEAHLATARNTCRVSQARRIPKPSRVDALPRHARAAASSIGPDLPSTAVLGRVAA
jgi:DNA-directed RNA polymerase specialized sigma24 family protein